MRSSSEIESIDPGARNTRTFAPRTDEGVRPYLSGMRERLG